MRPVRVESKTQIDALQPDVHAYLADYPANRHALLPPRWADRGLTIEQGGRGAGTVYRHLVRLGLRQQMATFEVREPMEGRVVVEQGLDVPLLTTWTVYTGAGGFGTRVLAVSVWSGLKRGRAWMNEALVRRQLQRVHDVAFEALRRDLPMDAAAP